MQGRSDELSIEELASNLSTYEQQLQQVDLFLSISNSNKVEELVVVYGISTEDIIGHVCKISPEEIETELKEAAMISMGSEVSDRVLSLAEYIAQLYDYLKSRVNTIAPNVTSLVGELVGARLIAHGDSLLNLAEQPGSTVQILGVENALFQAAPKHNGKITRSLTAKTALAIRYDTLGDGQDGLDNRIKGSAHTGPALIPAEVLVAIHAINAEKDGLPLKKVVMYISPPEYMHDIIDDNGPEMSDE